MSKYGPEFAPSDYSDVSGGGLAAPEAALPTLFYHELSLDLEAIRNPVTREFFNKQDFIPFYWQEITIATKKLGLADALFAARFSNNNVHNPVEKQVRAAENTYERVEGYVKRSETKLKSLRLAFGEGQDLPSVDEIRSNDQILDTIASFILAFRKVEAENWPAWNAGVLASALEQIKGQLILVSDEEIIALWDMARLNHNNRLKFWNSQIMSVKQNKIVQDINKLRDSRHASQPAPGEGRAEVVEYEDMVEQLAEPEASADDSQTNILPNGAMLLEGTDVPIASRPVDHMSRSPKAEPQTETLFAVAPKPKRESRRTKPVRGTLAMFADAGRIPQHELDQKAGRETVQPMTNPDADLDEIFGAAPAKKDL